MPAINVVGFPSSQKTPGIYLAVVLGGPGTAAGVPPTKLLLLGNMIPTAISVVPYSGGPTITTAAGTYQSSGTPTQVPIQIFSADDAKVRFGAGSELHMMAGAAFGENANTTVWACPTPQGTGSATGVITFTGAPASAMTVRAIINGRSIDSAIGASDTLTTIAANLSLAITQQTGWAVTSVAALGVITLTAKCAGLRGNFHSFRVLLINGATTAKATGGALAATLNGLTVTLSGGAALGNTYRLAGGSTEESVATALTNSATMLFDRIATPHQTYASSGPLSAIAAQLTSMASVTTQLRQQALHGMTDTQANTTAVAALLNAPRFQTVWHFAGDSQPGEVAAAVGAGRIMGDGYVGGSHVGEATDPAANLDGLQLGVIPAQDVVADQPTPTQLEAVLNVGVTPLAPSAQLPGYTQVVRSITTNWKDSQGNPNYAVIDTSSVTVSDYVAVLLQSNLAIAFAGTKLGVDDPSGAGPRIPNMVTPSIVRSFILKTLKDEEALGHIINVDAHTAQLVVIADNATPGRLLADIPVVPAPSFHQLGGNVRQLSS